MTSNEGEPESDAQWENFQSFLVDLKDVVAHHFGHAEQYDHWVMADFIWKRQSNCLDEFWSKNEVLNDLAQLKSSLKVIERVLEKLPEAVSDEIRRASMRPLLGRRKADVLEEYNATPDELLSTLPSRQAYLSLLAMPDHISDILPLIDAAEKLAATGTPVGNKGLEAWRTVEACAELCELFPGTIPVHKTMGSSGPFYRFVGDVFYAVGLKNADPEAAFKGWRRHVVRKGQENL